MRSMAMVMGIMMVIVSASAAWGYETDINNVDLADISAYFDADSSANKLQVGFSYRNTNTDQSVLWDVGSAQCNCVAYKNNSEHTYDTTVKGDTLSSKNQTMTDSSQDMYMDLPATIINPHNRLAVECHISVNGKDFTILDNFTHENVIIGNDGTLTYYLPLFSDAPGDWTGIGLSNLNTSAAADISVFIYSADGSSRTTENRTIPAGGQDAFVVGSGLDTSGALIVESSQPLAGLCFVGREDGSYMADVPFSSMLSGSLVLPHVAQDSHWDTRIYLSNPNSIANTAGMTFTRPDGSAPYAIYNVDLPAYGSASVDLSTITAGNSEDKGRLNITANAGITAFAIYYNLKTGGYSYSGIYAVNIQ